jgi:NAD-dependent deacetylase
MNLESLVYPEAGARVIVPGEVERLVRSRNWSRVIVLAGAGLSVASGIPTFRGAGGYYQGRDAASLASPEGFASDPVLVWNWYAMRIRAVLLAEPNAGHRALTELVSGVPTAVITSNVDDLHDRAGHIPVRLHGNILESRCTVTGVVSPHDVSSWPDEFDFDSLPRSSESDLLRPNVVWFGERPWTRPFEIVQGVDGTELFIEVGTSGVVSYGFTEHAAGMGCSVVRVNPDGERYRGVVTWEESSDNALPRLVELILSSL